VHIVAPTKKHTMCVFLLGITKYFYDTMYRMTIRVVLFLTTLFVLAMTHFVAQQFYLYWVYVWFDIPMHILGGICVALGFSILPFFNINLPSKYTKLGAYLAVVFFVSVLWEIFEYMNGISLVLEEYFVTDTIMDFIFALFGGAIGYYIATRVSDF